MCSWLHKHKHHVQVIMGVFFKGVLPMLQTISFFGCVHGFFMLHMLGLIFSDLVELKGDLLQVVLLHGNV
jgi:hypothetical protein